MFWHQRHFPNQEGEQRGQLLGQLPCFLPLTQGNRDGGWGSAAPWGPRSPCPLQWAPLRALCREGCEQGDFSCCTEARS